MIGYTISIFIVCIVLYLVFIRKPNRNFTLISDTRVVRRNGGDGNKYYPEYLVKKWIPFKNREFDGFKHMAVFNSVDSALDFINSQRIKLNPEEEIMTSKVYSKSNT